MEIDTLLGAFRDFEKKGEKETCPILDQFLSHVARTGETMIQWSQFKSYFLFKLEKVMDDFNASCPEQRGPANPNVEYIPFEEMKQRILKIVNGYNGIPFTIQRLCELLTEPKRNYTGTDKFLRGVEKNVMVVSCVYPTSEKKGCVNRMNGVMFPGNTSAFPDRNVNGPGTPRPLNRPKLSLSSSVATNGLPDSTESKEQSPDQSERTANESSASEAEVSHGGSVKSKHCEDEDVTNAETHEAKRLKFDDENYEDEMEKRQEGKESPCSTATESSPDMPQSSSDVTAEVKDNKQDEFNAEDQEPSSTQSESPENGFDRSSSEGSPSPSHNEESDPPEQEQPKREESAEAQQTEERNDPVSSSSNNSSEEGASSPETASACPSSSTELSAEGSTTADISSDSSDTAEDAMEQE
ncbi:serine/threonine-protein phosphatase 4 regulatory subunit 2-A [Triplophysa rosa]|uniref:Serine/threonine-protein phosphatase 4 regulatory subunit 2-A n=1 Tax=Triplophysa rosa TaxID=992332 RepID=A0A9W7TCD5_TRIRA|nr:serine/threonine-protein phosphatase 4 regulatory subunit 2-A [Triplophysa rosa]KAI7793883.1 serine/threonine-protein phosphatase 4 regulatory subunit 2-A [Triplophysa rosa]